MENYPNRHRNHEIETLSDRFLKNYIPVSWITNFFEIDYGTDYNCEITSERQVTGNNFSIQLKGKETEQNQDSIKIILKRTNINRLLNRLEPTIIIVYIVDENEAYWKWFEDNTVDLTQSNDSYTVSIPRDNKLSKLNWTVISEHVICVVHQIRNACKYIVWKDRKAITADMKHIYTASNKQTAEAALQDFAEKWESKYSYAVTSWKENWDELTVFLDLPLEIRKIHLYHQLN